MKNFAMSAVALLLLASTQSVMAQGKKQKLEKMNGYVRVGDFKSKTFVMSAQKGAVTIDATKAKITLKGKPFNLVNLTAGSSVMIEGKLTSTGSGKTAKHRIDAVSVDVTFLRGTSIKPVFAPSAAGTKPNPNTKTKTGGK